MAPVVPAMAIGCDVVLMNTAVAEAKDPTRMATAMKHAVIAAARACSPAACPCAPTPIPPRPWPA